MALITMNIEQFNIDNLFFMDSVKNMVMKNGDFVKFIYSDDNCIMNSIYFKLSLQFSSFETNYNKIKYLYNIFDPMNYYYINQLCKIEKEILLSYNIPNKTPVYRICENLYNGNIQFNIEQFDINNININNKYSQYFIKMSGIWENTVEYGITYKFIHI